MIKRILVALALGVILIGSSPVIASAYINAQMQDRYIIADVAGLRMNADQRCDVYHKLQRIDTSSARTFKDAVEQRNNEVCK